jgi:hypothetical protein
LKPWLAIMISRARWPLPLKSIFSDIQSISFDVVY